MRHIDAPVIRFLTVTRLFFSCEIFDQTKYLATSVPLPEDTIV